MRVGEESNTILNTSKVEEEDFNCCNGPNMTHPMCFPIGWYQYHHFPKILNEYYSYISIKSIFSTTTNNIVITTLISHHNDHQHCDFLSSTSFCFQRFRRTTTFLLSMTGAACTSSAQMPDSGIINI